MSSLRTSLAQYQARAGEFWNARTEQERKLLTIGGAVVGLALFYVLLVDPALSGRAKLNKELPELRQQAAELQALAVEAAALNGQPSVPPAPMSRESINTSLQARGLTAQNVMVTGEYAKLEFKGVAFAGLVTWLDAMRRENQLTVQETTVTAQSTAGMVDAAVTLHQSGAAR
ncbi:type II secretion system protein GspM [Pseudoduganella violacea]|uniref:General secretion pathway protein M n=1 Tax=Pseudoduganella violacea TaxID=1715466 RepID=A0A7W5BEV8_9BURK|nr:type II secretion system protein M [Pseudoduganella violacea]MBB3121876.1 general secretion pathway protein M [Pseudoduganella violacea]